MGEKYFSYVLENSKGLLYKGSTENLSQRLEQHNSNDGFRSWTHGRGPWKLVHFEEFSTFAEAKNREKYFKSGAGRDWLKKHLGGGLSASADG